MENVRYPGGSSFHPSPDPAPTGHSTPGARGSTKTSARRSAEDRLRASWNSVVWIGIIVSTVIHFIFFVFWPQFTAEDIALTAAELELAEIVPEVEIPPAPEAISRPATPVVAEGLEIDEDVTIAPTTFAENPVSDLPAPPEEKRIRDLSAAPTFTPFTVKPDLRNRREVAAALTREYPPLLRDAGIGGTVLVWFFIDEDGRVRETLVKQTSGQRALDRAALAVAQVFRFSPALNRDKRVPVWISLPIIFQSR